MVPCVCVCVCVDLTISVVWFLKGPRLMKSDLNLMQLIKAGKEGVFYQARMTRGTCKGHGLFTCKISKEGGLDQPLMLTQQG